MTLLTDAELALWLDPERRMPGWWLEGWCYNSAGETECMGDTYHGPAFSTDNLAAFTHLRGPLWDGFYMRALGWPLVYLANDKRWRVANDIKSLTRMTILGKGPTPTAALRAAWLAKGAKA